MQKVRDTIETVIEETTPRRRRTRLTFLGVLQEAFILIAIVGALFVVWWLWAGDFLHGSQDDADANSIAEEWNSPTTDKGWLGSTEIAVTEDPEEEATEYGVVYIPRFGTDYARTLAEGTELWNVLNNGWFGHYTGTAGMGEVGNFSLAGHRTTYGAPMNLAEELKVGDPIIIQSEKGWYIYRVAEGYVTLPTDINTIFPVPKGEAGDVPTERWLTITTCHPLHSAAERHITHATFDRFVPAGQVVPSEVTTAAGADTTVYVTTSVPEETP